MAAASGDRIRLRDVRFAAQVGILPGENQVSQPIRADLDLWLDLGAAARSDELGDSFDYRLLPPLFAQVAKAGPFGLLEALAAALLDGLFTHPQLSRVRVRLSKLRPPLGEGVGAVSVELDRERRQWQAR